MLTSSLIIRNKKVKKRARTILREDQINYAKKYYTIKLAKAKRVIQRQKINKEFPPLVRKKQSRPKKATVKNTQVLLVVFLILVLKLNSYMNLH